MEHKFKIPRQALLAFLVMLALVLACEEPVGSVTENTEAYILWEPDATAMAFIAQSTYTGMSPEELARYYFAYNVEYKVETASNLGLVGYVAIPMNRAVPILPLGEVIAPIAGTSPITALLAGSAVAYATTFSPEYQAKMATIEGAKTIPPDAQVLVPSFVSSTALSIEITPERWTQDGVRTAMMAMNPYITHFSCGPEGTSIQWNNEWFHWPDKNCPPDDDEKGWKAFLIDLLKDLMGPIE